MTMVSTVSRLGVYEMEVDETEGRVYFSNRIGECKAVFNIESPNIKKWMDEHVNDTLHESVGGK